MVLMMTTMMMVMLSIWTLGESLVTLNFFLNVIYDDLMLKMTLNLFLSANPRVDIWTIIGNYAPKHKPVEIHVNML